VRLGRASNTVWMTKTPKPYGIRDSTPGANKRQSAMVTVQRSEIDEAVRKCEWLEFQILFILAGLDSTNLRIEWVRAGRRVKVVKPSRVFGDWDGVGFADDGPYP
jgi:hypothetical protein